MPTGKWDAPGVRAHFVRKVEGNMRVAVAYGKGQVQRSINRGNADGSNPSDAGEPPKKVTGRLFQSIATEVRSSPKEVVGSIGSNLKYARMLELGTAKMEQRPFLRRMLKEHARQLKEIITKR